MHIKSKKLKSILTVIDQKGHAANTARPLGIVMQEEVTLSLIHI